MEPTHEVIAYASPVTGKPRVTYRGAIVTLIVGGAFLLLGIGLLILAWAVFEGVSKGNSYRVSNLESLGVFTCFVAGFFFLVGTTIVFIGLRGARERSVD